MRVYLDLLRSHICKIVNIHILTKSSIILEPLLSCEYARIRPVVFELLNAFVYFIYLRVLHFILIADEALVPGKFVEIVAIHLSQGEIINLIWLDHTVRRVEITLDLDFLRGGQVTQDWVIFLQTTPEAFNVS